MQKQSPRGPRSTDPENPAARTVPLGAQHVDGHGGRAAVSPVCYLAGEHCLVYRTAAVGRATAYGDILAVRVVHTLPKFLRAPPFTPAPPANIIAKEPALLGVLAHHSAEMRDKVDDVMEVRHRRTV